MDIIPIHQWGLSIEGKWPLVISGPCSAETEEQVMASCEGVANQGAHILRAGIWKPRTRPNSFEGVGKPALPWIVEAGRRTGLPVMVEVANASHVEAALKYDIDIFWIGARTTVNPFAVQEVADALWGTDKPLFIKNPINPDLELWIGAIERFYNAGLKKLAGIHRGFSLSNSAPYRNRPKWEIPIELKRRLPGFQVICDPSHICGKRELLAEVAQQALDLDFEGLMLEAHIDPLNAWSDAAQQVTPDGLGKILKNLIKRDHTISDPEVVASLENLREKIDEADAQIMKALALRMQIARKIGYYKKENNIGILQMKRWMEIFSTRKAMAKKGQLSDTFAETFLQAVHKESIKQQTEVMNEENASLKEKE